MTELDVIVSYSGGVTSFEAGRRAMQTYGKDRCRWLFMDTRTEDEDLYRFNDDVKRLLDVDIEILDQGMDVWETFFKVRMMGNSRFDPCSKNLKREPFRRWLKEHYPDGCIIVFGMDDIEDCNRIKRLKEIWADTPYTLDFPLNEPPLGKQVIFDWLRKHGVEPPRLYEMGFKHNNCGGMCIKAGLGQWQHLLKVMPERFAYHEQKEQEFREQIAPNQTILKQAGRKITLSEFRQMVADGYTWKNDVDFSCNCLIPEDIVAKYGGE